MPRNKLSKGLFLLTMTLGLLSQEAMSLAQPPTIFAQEPNLQENPMQNNNDLILAQDVLVEDNNNGSQQPSMRQEQINIFLKSYPYETSRFTSVCQRNAAASAGDFASFTRRREIVVQEYFRTDRKLPGHLFVDTNEAINEEIRGVGVRVVVVIYSRRRNLNLSFLTSLIGIGLAADANRISGTVSIETYGLGGRNLTSVIPVPTEISVESMTEALATINNIKMQLVTDTNEQFISSLELSSTEPSVIEISSGDLRINPLPIINFPVLDAQEIKNICARKRK